MNYHNDDWIFEQLSRHYEIAKTKYSEDSILGVILRGSQNYNLDSENSDVDTICIIAPTFEEMTQNKELVSYEYIDPETKEHIVFKDVRLYVDCLRKQGINFVETLFTKYYIINNKYKYEWEKLVHFKEEISWYDPNRAINAAYGIFNKYYKVCQTILETNDGVSGKIVSRLPQMVHFLENYTCNEDYVRCITPNPDVKLIKESEWIDAIQVNTWMESWRKVADHYYNIFSKVRHKYSENNICEKAFYNFCYNTIWTNCAKEFIVNE